MADTFAAASEDAVRTDREGGAAHGASADLVVGLALPAKDQDAIANAVESTRAALSDFAAGLRAVVVHAGATSAEPANPADPVQIVPMPAPPGVSAEAATSLQGYADGFRAIVNVAKTLQARACAIIGSDATSIDRNWIAHLAGPVLEGGFDLVSPCYARHRFEGLINRGIIYPLVRALYGRRVRNPFGPDFCLSARLFERVPAATGQPARVHPVASLVPEAIVTGMRICQSHLGVRHYPSPDDAGLSVLLTQILAPLFSEIERRAAFLQRVRGSQPVEEFGAPAYLPEQPTGTDVSRLIESFQIGTRNLQEIWSVVLPPSTIVELRHLARAPATNFQMQDELWARIVYDFALAYRVRSINRDHLLRAITPLYLGWVASYALKPDNTSAEAAESIVERLCAAYENTRPYFVARWRWPDRFNP